VFVNPAYQGRGEAAIPFCLDVKIPPADEAAQQRSEELWDRKLQARLIERCLRDRVDWTPETMAAQLRERFEFVDQILLPMPEIANQPIDPIEKFESTTFEDLAASVENW
jgi:type IV secretion system protein VirD4